MLIKVCGLRFKKDIQVCEEIGADFLGFIFHPASSRYVEPETVSALPRTGAMRVGVFVRQDVQEVKAIMQRAELDLAQLHGEYSPRDCWYIGKERAIKVFWPDRYTGINSFNRELKRYTEYCRYFLFDAGTQGGGHGKSIRNHLLSEMSCHNPWFLAGGLTPESLAKQLKQYNPDGIDLNSGVEKAPGDKDEDKLRAIKDYI